jgi:hypothetical protein
MVKFTTFQGVSKSLEGIKREGRVELMISVRDPASKLGGFDNEAKLETTGLRVPSRSSGEGESFSETLEDLAL